MRPNVLELVEKINRLLQPAKFQHLTKLEADLLKDYLRSLYDVLDDPAFGTTPNTASAPAPKHEIEEVLSAKPEQESLQPEDLLIEVNAAEKELQPAMEVEQVKASHPEQEQPQTEEVVIKKHEPSAKGSLNETIKTSSSSLNEKLKAAGSEVNKKLAIRPLKELIDFNKRHALISELFKGDQSAYANAVQELDNLPAFEQAENYLTNKLAPAYQWDMEDQTTRMFVKLIKQRYGQA